MAGASGSRVASKTGVMSPLYDLGSQVFRDKETVSRASTGARLVTESLLHLLRASGLRLRERYVNQAGMTG